MRPRDYGARGRLGLLTPQANPTVEPEFRRLMPDDVELYVARLASPQDDPRGRLVDYLERLPQTLRQYDTLRLDAVAFACTGSSYLVGAGDEARLLAEATATIGAPVETATGAIRQALAEARARRIVLLSPYPGWLQAAAVAYWEAAGLEVLRTASIATPSADTRGIYELGSADAAAALAALDPAGADAVLLSGTGLPTLAVLRDHGPRRPLLLSSNLCLAWRLQAHLPDAVLPASPQELLA